VSLQEHLKLLFRAARTESEGLRLDWRGRCVEGTGFRVLGEIGLWVAGESVPIRGERQQGILAALLAEPRRPTPGDQLIERVWGNHRRPHRPVNALQTHLTLLRRTLARVEDVAIQWKPAGYRLVVNEHAVDLHQFHALIDQVRTAEHDDKTVTLLRRALGLWRGEPFGAQDTPWFNAARATLDRKRYAVELDLTDARLRCGEHASLVAELIGQAEDNPWDERLVGQLMLALYSVFQSVITTRAWVKDQDMLMLRHSSSP
jgi:DNA-binding SARP family transcriptional activator